MEYVFSFLAGMLTVAAAILVLIAIGVTFDAKKVKKDNVQWELWRRSLMPGQLVQWKDRKVEFFEYCVDRSHARIKTVVHLEDLTPVNQAQAIAWLQQTAAPTNER